jgi:hypothetical protein
MRWNGCFISIALAALMSSAAPCVAATFGTVVPIGGHASDIALDESRGVLYIANFTANRIEVMNTADYSIKSSMNVAAQPAALSLSPDSKYLLVAHYGSVNPPDPSRNAVTLINLNDNTRQTFTTGDTPLGVAFLANGIAVTVTTTSLVSFDPISGAMNVVGSFGSLAKQIPVPLATFPTQIVLASVATNADRTVLYALTDDNASQGFIRWDTRPGGSLIGFGVVAAPKPLPRVAVSPDGSRAVMNEYLLDGFANNLAQFPNAVASLNPGAAVFDTKTGNIWGQILTGTTTTTTSVTGATTTTTTTGAPVLSLMDSENLYVYESYSLPENLTGRAVLTAANDVLLLRQRQRRDGVPGRTERRGSAGELLQPQRDHTDRHDHRSGRREHGFRHQFQYSGRHHFARARNHPGSSPGHGRSHRVPEPERNPGGKPDHEFLHGGEYPATHPAPD